MRYTLTRTFMIALIVIVMCLLFIPWMGGKTHSASLVRLEAQADEVLLHDSFDRGDSPQLGAPWLEAGEVTAEFTTAAGYHVGPARTEVSGGALSFSYVNHTLKPQFPFTSVNGRPVVYAPLARSIIVRPSVFSFTFEPHPDDRIAHQTGLMSAAGGFRAVTDASGVVNRTPVDGFGVAFGRSSTAFNNSQVSIIKYEGGTRTILAEKLLGLQFASGKKYSLSLTVAPDFSATVLVSDGVNTEQLASPATAVSFPLDQFFIADVEGGISSDTREAGGFSLRFDDVTVREITPAPTPTPSPVPTPTPTPAGILRLLLDVGGPSELPVNNNRYDPNPFTLSAVVINDGTATATDVTMAVDLPAGLSFDSSPTLVSVGDLSPGERRSVDWSLRADFQTEPVTLAYTVLLRAEGTLVETVPRQLKVPKLNPPVLIIPGVYGTELYKGTDQLWLDASKVILSPSDDHLDPLVFAPDLQPTDTSIRTGAVIREVNVLFERWDFDYTKSLIEELDSHGYREGEDQFTFPYDWRFGVSPEVVSELKRQFDYIRQKTGSPKVDVIAHSTGGLILKQYVKDYADPGVGKAVFVGVPITGAPKAVWVMLTGDTGLRRHSRDEMRKLARNMPVVYDLAPSRQYYSSFFQLYRLSVSSSTAGQDLNFDDAYNQLATIYGMNSDAITRSEGVHSASFDGYDLRDKNVQVYRITGCKEPTIRKVIANLRMGQSTGPENFSPEYAPGDGTVPVESATYLPVDSDKRYYALTGEHGTMLSQEGIKQEIVKLITGIQSINPGDSITQDVSRCELNGKAIEVHSPLDIAVTDQDGNFAVRLEDGTFLNTIPGAAFNSAGAHKFVFLPDDAGQTYDFRVAGTDTGTFTLEVKNIRNSKQTAAAVFPNLPVTTELRGELNLNAGQPELRLDTNGDGTQDVTVTPPVTLTEEQLRRREELNAAGTTLAPPSAVPSTGTYTGTQTISLTAPDWDMIYYTTDGSTPSCDGTGGGSRLYMGPLTVVSSKSVKAIGCLAGGFGSQPVSFTYSINRSVPLLNSPPAMTISAGANDCGVFIGDSSLGWPTINDIWPGVIVSRTGVPASSIFPLGQTTLTYTASDSQGNFATVAQLVTVVDTSPPDLTVISVDKAVLSASNHKYVDVTLSYAARDSCGLVTTSVSVTSNEPVNGTGDGDTAPDWQVVDAHHVRLRAERAGSGNGRVYTVTITATDMSGNPTRRSVTVAVPKGNLK